MFLYQTKINGKDGLVAASQTQDAGRQVPIYNEEVLAVLEDNGVLKEDTVAIKEGGDSFKVSISLDQTSVSISRFSQEYIELVATTVPDDGTLVTWATSNPSVAWADDLQNGTAILMRTGVGTCVITATITYEGVSKSATCEVEVIDDLSIALDQTALTIQTGEQPELTATVTPDDVLDWVEWSSSDPLVASADAMTERVGMVQPLAAGTCTITASITVEGITKTATCAVTVTG